MKKQMKLLLLSLLINGSFSLNLLAMDNDIEEAYDTPVYSVLADEDAEDVREETTEEVTESGRTISSDARLERKRRAISDVHTICLAENQNEIEARIENLRENETVGAAALEKIANEMTVIIEHIALLKDRELETRLAHEVAVKELETTGNELERLLANLVLKRVSVIKDCEDTVVLVRQLKKRLEDLKKAEIKANKRFYKPWTWLD
jgi:chromosome segregation ATPase